MCEITIPFTAEKNSKTQTLPKRNNVRDHDPVHGREKLTNIETLPQSLWQRNNVRDHDPIHSRKAVTDVETLPQMNAVRDHDHGSIHWREAVTNL